MSLVRVARPGDAPALAAVHVQGWRETYAHHGTGLGQALLDAALGGHPAFCWVAEDNPRARAFYGRNGLRPDGGRRAVPEWEDLVEIRLVR